jgi:hypothetical protein
MKAELDALWSALWRDLMKNATGQAVGVAIIERHRAAIEAEAAGDNEPGCYVISPDHLERLQAEARRAEGDRYRRWLWLKHGHEDIFGTDGQLQCGLCGIDYLTAELDECERAASDAIADCRKGTEDALRMAMQENGRALSAAADRVAEVREERLRSEHLERALRRITNLPAAQAAEACAIAIAALDTPEVSIP